MSSEYGLLGEGSETFAFMLVRDFLKRKEMFRSLAVFDAEIRRGKCEDMKNEDIATNTWLSMSKRFGLPTNTMEEATRRSSFEDILTRAAGALDALLVSRRSDGIRQTKTSSHNSRVLTIKTTKKGVRFDTDKTTEAKTTVVGTEVSPQHRDDRPRKSSIRSKTSFKKTSTLTTPTWKTSSKWSKKIDSTASFRDRKSQTAPLYLNDVSPKSNASANQSHKSRSPSPSLSNESWIPMRVRMRMLQRDLNVLKVNRESKQQLDEIFFDKDKGIGKTRHAKRNDELLRRGRKNRTCALCDMCFVAANLPFSVSYKAIIDLRLSWGVEIPPDARYSRFPHWYKSVKVCKFCSQFFQLKGGLFDSPNRGLLKKGTLSENDEHTLAKMGLRSRQKLSKRSTVVGHITGGFS